MNDTYGHQVGDEYLYLTTSVLRVGLPEEALKFRTGGDEFLVIIPKTTKEQGERHIEHMESYSRYVTLRQKVAFPVFTEQARKITCGPFFSDSQSEPEC